MSLSVHRRPSDAAAAAGKGGPIAARGAGTHRHHAPAAASASASATSSYSLSPEGADPALPFPAWQPLPRSLPKRRRAGTSTSADDASVPALRMRRTTARMTWPPERTPRCGLAGGDGALSSPKPRGLTREEDYLGWLGSLRSRPQPRGASASAPPSPTASSAARVPPPRRSGGINASASSTNVSPNALPGTPKGRPQASATSPLASAPPVLSALATAFLGARRHPPMTKQLTGTRSTSLRPKAKLPTGADSALPPLPKTKPTTPDPPLQTGLAPPRPLLPAFAHRIIEVLFNLNYGHRCSPTPQLNKPTTRACCDASLALTSGDSTLPPHMAAFSQRLIEILFDLNYGHLGYTGVVLMGVYAGLKELLFGWNTILKVSYVLLLILGAFGLGTGLMAATSIAPNGYTHRVSSVCSRLCTCLATFVFIVALACHMGSHGYIAGIVLGVVAVCYMLSVWIEGDPAAYGAYTRVWTAIKYLWQRFKWSGQREPLLP